MKTIYLLPRYFRFLGLVIIVAVLIAFISNPEIVFGGSGFMLDKDAKLVAKVPMYFAGNETDGYQFLSWERNDLLNEILLTITLIAAYFITFSKVKDEDEFTMHLRFVSFAKAILINSIFLLLSNWLIYDGLFLYVMIFQLFSFLIIFSGVFAINLRSVRNEK